VDHERVPMLSLKAILQQLRQHPRRTRPRPLVAVLKQSTIHNARLCLLMTQGRDRSSHEGQANARYLVDLLCYVREDRCTEDMLSAIKPTDMVSGRLTHISVFEGGGLTLFMMGR